jgi:hypothetical protein
MKDSDRDQILRAYDEAAQSLHFESFPAFLRYVCDKTQEHINRVRHARTREGLEAWLMKEPDMSPGELKATLEAIRLIPQTLRKELPKAAKEAAKQFPHDPGGHPKSIKDEKWPEIYVEILESIGNGKNEREALKIAAKKNKVSLKTIQRGWRRRGQTDGQTLIND